MCGIVFKHNFDKKKPVNNDILQQYDKQSHRGKQGFGVFDGQFMHIVRESREDNILKWLVTKNSNLILFHHRLPTSTVNVARAAHPFSTKKHFGKTEYILCHNGMIRNAEDLWVAHQKLGIRYQSMLEDLSFNDSEALLWDFALVMEGKQPHMKALGNMAFICMKKVNGKLVSMLYGRNTNPLMIKRTVDSLELASEGAGVAIIPDTLYEFDFKTHVTSKKQMEFPVYKSYSTTTQRVPNTGTYPNSGFRTPLKQTSLLSATSTGVHAIHDAADRPEDFASYDKWYEAKYGKRTAPPIKDPETNWQRLRAKYGKKVNGVRNAAEMKQAVDAIRKLESLGTAGVKSIGQILDAKKDKNGMFVTEVKHEDVPVNIDELDLRDYTPTSSEIQRCAMDYMIEAEGNFEDAYGLIEMAYADFLDVIKGHETFADIRQTLLFEAAMEFINSDDEYENEKSVSSIWRALWHQKKVVTA